VIPCNLVGGYPCFRGTSCFHLKLGAAESSETVSAKTTWHDNSEDHTLDTIFLVTMLLHYILDSINGNEIFIFIYNIMHTFSCICVKLLLQVRNI
jgi:hypothetical protein